MERDRWHLVAVGGAIPMLALLVLPVVALVMGASVETLVAGMKNPLFRAALLVSGKTTMVSLGLIVGLGTPLAWWLASLDGRRGRFLELLVELPVVLPPAVVGIGLLEAFGRRGLLGPGLESLGLQIPFTMSAVVLAQTVVAAPFYIQSAIAAFRRVDRELLLVARTLGATRRQALFRVAIPLALPGLIGGAVLSWARAVGEFGATLLFAGNLPGTTQTVPLAIYMALETDVRVALALSLCLAGVALVALLGVRVLPALLRPQGGRQ